MKRTRLVVAGVVAAVGLTACSRGDAAPADLGHELDVATGDTSGLLPNRGGTQFVSAIERTPGAAPAATPPVKRPAPTPRAEQQPVESPVTVKKADPVAVVAAPAPAPSPTPTPTPTPRRKGGYATMGDIMRNAPFPINPVDAQKPKH